MIMRELMALTFQAAQALSTAPAFQSFAQWMNLAEADSAQCTRHHGGRCFLRAITVGDDDLVVVAMPDRGCRGAPCGA